MIVTKTRSAVAIAAILVASAATGFGIDALGGEGAGDDAPPGLERVDSRLITTDGTNYDPTILTKFIPGTAFAARKGSGIEDDRTDHVFGGTCVFAATGSGGTLTEFRAGVELPDGALIKRITFFGDDDDALRNILVRLNRTTVTSPPGATGVTTRSDETITSYTTSGFAGVVVVSSPDLDESVGSIPGATAAAPGQHRFHTVYVELSNSAGIAHKLCGVEVEYQVPISVADPGTVFHPIAPIRAFDSRIGAYAGSGILAPNTSRVILVKDAHDLAGAVSMLDAVPIGATAVAYNISIANPTGPNFISVTPGDAAAFTTSAINFGGTSNLANAAIVSIDAQRQIKVWGGDLTGSAHVIIDITGYFAAPRDLPNMGN